jgi:hypothetical protein
MLKRTTTRRAVLAGAIMLPARNEIMSWWPYSKVVSTFSNATPYTGSLLDPSRWDILYSPGMPSHPYADASGGWHFNFPSPPDSIHYATITINRPIGGTFSADMKVDAQNAIFNFRIGDPTNTGTAPPACHLFFQQQGDDLSGSGPMQFYRWWSTPFAFVLANGAATLSVPLTPDKWLSVFGLRGTDSAAAQAGFAQAMAKTANVGLTFGGGSYYGHGVNVTSGTARFIMRNFSVG